MGNTVSEIARVLTRPPTKADVSHLTGTDLETIMRGWTNACDTSHRRCRSLRESTGTASSLPARVIDVGDGDNDPFLYATTAGNRNSSVGDNNNIRYLALSYCWGDRPPPKTLTTNFDDHCRPGGLRFSDLPETFRDAVRTARALGVQYLWIDSLCILQDSPEDMAKEIAKMHEIFRGAYAVLAAVDGRDSHFGLNIGQDALLRPGIWDFRLPAAVGRDGVPCRSLHSIQRGVWRTRAWTLQEEMLAGRILYFTHPFSSPTYSKCQKAQILWSCAETIWSEDGVTSIDVAEGAPLPLERFPPNVVTKYDGFYLEFSGYSQVSERVVDILLRSADKRLYQAWYALAEEYSRRRLTSLADKLYAIEALARIHGLKMGLVDSASFDGGVTRHNDCPAYLYGLWREDIIWGLSWMSKGSARWRNYDKGPLSKLPTWSWASVNGHVSWDVYDTPRLYTVISMGKSMARGFLQWHIAVRGRVLRNKRYKNGSYRDTTRKLEETYYFETDPSDIRAGRDELFQLLVSVRGDETRIESTRMYASEYTMMLLKKLDETYYSRVGWCRWTEVNYLAYGEAGHIKPIWNFGSVEDMTVRLV